MKITRLEGIAYRLPLHGALAWGAHSRLSAAEHVLVRVHLDDGTVGEAESPPRPTIYGETVASVLGILKHLDLPSWAWTSPTRRPSRRPAAAWPRT